MTVEAERPIRSDGFTWLLLAGWRAFQQFGSAVAELIRIAARKLRLNSLMGRIIGVNLIGLTILVGGHALTNQYQTWLIDAKRASLLAQGEIIARFLASSAVSANDGILPDPSALDLEPGAKIKVDIKRPTSVDLLFPIRPEKVGPIITYIVRETKTRARVYSDDGTLISDSDYLEILTRDDLPPPGAQPRIRIKGFWNKVAKFLDRSGLPIYRDIGRANGTAYPEVRAALGGATTQMRLLDEEGQQIVSVAVPIQPVKAVKGVLLLSTRGGEIDGLIETQWVANFTLILLALLSLIVSSLALAGTIAVPLKSLSQAAMQVKRSITRREELPDYSARGDEIGDLSQTLREMTNSLYRRIEESDRFAADTAHELKNPLTSVKSAADTLALVDSEEERRKFIDTIKYDVKRMTRLIDDINNASKVGSELALSAAQPVDLADLLETVVSVFNQVHVKGQQQVLLELGRSAIASEDFVVSGHDLRLGQVVNNLLDNALSFSPPDGRVFVRANRDGGQIWITVEDEGPGIPEGKFEKVFDRFYTDRPTASFGRNSGLGLSITRDIVEGHRGHIRAENRLSADGSGSTRVLGARFIVQLPAAAPTTTRFGRSAPARVSAARASGARQ